MLLPPHEHRSTAIVARVPWRCPLALSVALPLRRARLCALRRFAFDLVRDRRTTVEKVTVHSETINSNLQRNDVLGGLIHEIPSHLGRTYTLRLSEFECSGARYPR